MSPIMQRTRLGYGADDRRRRRQLLRGVRSRNIAGEVSANFNGAGEFDFRRASGGQG